jgi:hypothetical protein
VPYGRRGGTRLDIPANGILIREKSLDHHIDTRQGRQSSFEIERQVAFLALIARRAHLYVAPRQNGRAISVFGTVPVPAPGNG